MYYRDQLTKYGAAEVYYIPVTVDTSGNNTNTDVIDHIGTLTGFMFGGGDQLKIIESFYNGHSNQIVSPALLAIRESLLKTGGVIAGTSAGTDCQTDKVMITGGDSYVGLVDGSTMYWEAKSAPNVNKLTAYSHGIGIFPYGLLDTHFENRGRQGRLLRLLSDTSSYPICIWSR